MCKDRLAEPKARTVCYKQRLLEDLLFLNEHGHGFCALCEAQSYKYLSGVVMSMHAYQSPLVDLEECLV